MIKINSGLQTEIPGMESWRLQYSEKKLRLLEKSWAGVFRDFVLHELPVKKMIKYYDTDYGRPSKELRSLMGTVILQQFFNLTDEETIQELAFNQQWHFALECFLEEDQVVSLKTLWSARSRMVSENIGVEVFEKATSVLIKEFKVSTDKQRMDSVHVYSNMARLGRIRVLARTIEKFLRFLKREHKNLYNSKIKQDIKETYFKDKGLKLFGQVKPSESERTLQKLAEEMSEILNIFSNNDVIATTPAFKILERVFSEQCYQENDKIFVKNSKEVSCKSIQNPSDPDAEYDGHKGQGYQTQIVETYSEKNEAEEKPLNLITYVHTEAASNHDSKALKPALENLVQRNIYPSEILCDAAYGSNSNIEESKKKGVSVVAPTAGNKSNKGLESFVISKTDYRVTSCLAGFPPDELNKGKKSSITAKWLNDRCDSCPHKANCPTEKKKNHRTLRYTINEVITHFRRAYQESDEFKEKYRYRSGIEATNTRFIHQTEARRSRYRGLANLKFSQTLKALFVNIFRTLKSTIRQNFGPFFNIFSYFFYFNIKFELC